MNLAESQQQVRIQDQNQILEYNQGYQQIDSSNQNTKRIANSITPMKNFYEHQKQIRQAGPTVNIKKQDSIITVRDSFDLKEFIKRQKLKNQTLSNKNNYNNNDSQIQKQDIREFHQRNHSIIKNRPVVSGRNQPQLPNQPLLNYQVDPRIYKALYNRAKNKKIADYFQNPMGVIQQTLGQIYQSSPQSSMQNQQAATIIPTSSKIPSLSPPPAQRIQSEYQSNQSSVIKIPMSSNRGKNQQIGDQRFHNAKQRVLSQNAYEQNNNTMVLSSDLVDLNQTYSIIQDIKQQYGRQISDPSMKDEKQKWNKIVGFMTKNPKVLMQILQANDDDSMKQQLINANQDESLVMEFFKNRKVAQKANLMHLNNYGSPPKDSKYSVSVGARTSSQKKVKMQQQNYSKMQKNYYRQQENQQQEHKNNSKQQESNLPKHINRNITNQYQSQIPNINNYFSREDYNTVNNTTGNNINRNTHLYSDQIQTSDKFSSFSNQNQQYMFDDQIQMQNERAFIEQERMNLERARKSLEQQKQQMSYEKMLESERVKIQRERLAIESQKEMIKMEKYKLDSIRKDINDQRQSSIGSIQEGKQQYIHGEKAIENHQNLMSSPNLDSTKDFQLNQDSLMPTMSDNKLEFTSPKMFNNQFEDPQFTNQNQILAIDNNTSDALMNLENDGQYQLRLNDQQINPKLANYSEVKSTSSTQKITDWHKSPLMKDVQLNKSSFNLDQDIEYIVDSFKNRYKDFKRANLIDPLHSKALATLTEIMTSLNQTKQLNKIVESFKEANVQNTYKCLVRCRVMIEARNLMYEVLKDIQKHEQLVQDIKKVVDLHLEQSIDEDSIREIQALAMLLPNITMNLKNNIIRLRDEYKMFQRNGLTNKRAKILISNVFIYKKRDALKLILQEYEDIRNLVMVFDIKDLPFITEKQQESPNKLVDVRISRNSKLSQQSKNSTVNKIQQSAHKKKTFKDQSSPKGDNNREIQQDAQH
ncbi:UNKNOWN [Stylonychia lemnae]|uniref:Uncharacterized protein n=1 Tax=Stylonychia lemnae TaxID=5949 RepID=A0A078AER0_STYLE|nr:UNKNOWN [Stylonychia lemnae]|eukprot:CDW79972.1 UNKNOWN [Stylonychia lemnae]